MATAAQQPKETQKSRPVTEADALEFVREHGVVLVAARGPVPTLTHLIAGGTVRGSWWGHPKGRVMFRILESLTHSEEVLVCRLLNDKITLVHRRLWPALVRAASHFPERALSRVQQEHTPSGHHVNHETPFPDWVPPDVARSASRLTAAAALALLGASARRTIDAPRSRAASRRR